MVKKDDAGFFKLFFSINPNFLCANSSDTTRSMQILASNDVWQNAKVSTHVHAPLFSFKKAYRAGGTVECIRQLIHKTENEPKKKDCGSVSAASPSILSLYCLPNHARNKSGVVQCGCESEYTVGPTGLMVIAHNWESNFGRYNPRWIHQRHDTLG